MGDVARDQSITSSSSASLGSLAQVRLERSNFNLWGFDETNYKEPYRRLEVALKRAGWLEDLLTIERLDNFTRSIGLICT